MSFQPKNMILTKSLSNCDVARKTNKFDFLAKIMTIEAKYKFMDETIVDSLLFGYMAIV
jgi:hypothetical protein